MQAIKNEIIFLIISYSSFNSFSSAHCTFTCLSLNLKVETPSIPPSIGNTKKYFDNWIEVSSTQCFILLLKTIIFLHSQSVSFSNKLNAGEKIFQIDSNSHKKQISSNILFISCSTNMFSVCAAIRLYPPR